MELKSLHSLSITFQDNFSSLVLLSHSVPVLHVAFANTLVFIDISWSF